MNGFLRRSVFLLAFLPGLSGVVHAQTAALVRDINTTTPWSGSPLPAYDAPLLSLSGQVFFSSKEPAVAEGSGASSEILADLCPGDCASVYEIIGRMGNVANVALFVAQPEPDELRLYRTDGTRAGTYAVGEIGSTSLVREGEIVLAKDRVFFIRQEPDRFPELWVSDGTLTGTRQVPFPAGANPPSLFEMVAVGSRVFLINRQGELWRSDGTAAGTVLLHAFSETEPPSGLAAGTTRVYFSALVNGAEDFALWTSDGTPGGTLPVAGFPVESVSAASPSVAVGDHAYEAVDDLVHGQELWTTDGTATGSHRVSDLADSDPFGVYLGFPPPFVAEVGGRVVFATRQGLYSSNGTPGSTTLLTADRETVQWPLVQVGTRALFIGVNKDTQELWSTDGTAAGTARLVTNTDQLVAVGGVAYTLATDSRGQELWRSDGTPAGTRVYSDPLPPRVALTHLEAVGGRVFFLATSAPLSPIFELWTSDGQPGGTHAVPGLTVSGASAFPQSLVEAGNRLLFTACDGATRLAWQSDGTTAGTAPLATLPPGLAGCSTEKPVPYSGILDFTSAGEQVFFWAADANPLLWHLFWTDGVGNTRELATASSPLPLVPFGGEVFFAGSATPTAATTGSGLFRSDGTAAGTRLASEIPVNPGVFSIATAGGVLFLTAASGSATEVWASDGTAAGSRRLLSGSYSLSAGVLDLPSAFVQAGPWTYFFFSELGVVGAELWRTDGTAAGTARVAVGAFPAAAPLAFAGALYFLADEDDSRGLYRVDADPPGVTLLRRFVADSSTLFDDTPGLALFAGRLFFAADDGTHGRALWATDGTAGGTVQVATVGSGPETAGISQLTPAGDRLFFTAWDLAHGIELWQSDGTAAGTRLAADIAPEGNSSSPDQLTVAGGRLFFTADDGVTGRELWSLPLGSPAGCQPGDARLCLAAGRFKVEVAWKDFQGHAGVGHAVALTADTGYFWFFDPANVETVVKVLDARALNNAFWVFYGALSNVEYEITVTDTQTGLSRRYLNPSGRLASVGDTAGFGPQGAYDAERWTPAPVLPFVAARTDAKAATGACAPGPGQLCLQGGRFAVTSAWKDFQGRTGTGTAVPLSGDTGYFWFFAPTNVEVVTKVLDGTGLNGKFWFFYGALSNVEYTLTVTDTRTGAVRTYRNPSGQFGSVADTGAF
jgi:ELWxxDGT repeat protein